MKKISANTTSKYVVSTLITVVCTAGVALAWSGLNASPGDKLDAAKWNELVNTVQSGRIPGEIAIFNLATCPTGWSAYTAGQGRAIIGAGTGAGLTARNLGDTGGGESAPSVNLAGATATVNMSGVGASTTVTVGTNTVGGIAVVNGNGGLTSTIAGPSGAAIYLPAGTGPTSPVALGGVSTSITGTPTVNITGTVGGNSTDNMQPFVALLYCQKN